MGSPRRPPRTESGLEQRKGAAGAECMMLAASRCYFWGLDQGAGYEPRGERMVVVVVVPVPGCVVIWTPRGHIVMMLR